MPRSRPQKIEEIRYEYSLGPKEQGLVRELTKTLEATNKKLDVERYSKVAIGSAYAIGIPLTGYFIYKGVDHLAAAWQGVYEKWLPFSKDKTKNPLTGEELQEGWKGQHYFLDWLFS